MALSLKAVWFTLCCRNLFQPQLLSLDNDDIDVNQLIVRRPDILPRGIRQSSDGVVMVPDYSSVVNGDDESMRLVLDGADAPVLQSVAVLGTAVVVCGFGARFCRRRRRTRQRRKHVRVAPPARHSRLTR